MKEQRPFSHPIPTPNIARPRQPRPNPSPNMTPEAQAAAKAANKAAEKQTVSSMLKGIYQKVTSSASSAARQGPTGSAKAMADKRDQIAKLKGQY